MPSRVRRLVRRVAGRVGLARTPRVPELVNWDLTYACPLRCGYCYSESGRRPSRQLALSDLFAIADRLLQLRPVPEVVFTGGEPIVVKGFLDVAERLARGGARLAIYTSGWKLGQETADAIARLFDRVAVSLDAADAETNDRLRERRGAFDEAIHALERLDGAIAKARRARRSPRTAFCIECTVVRSNVAGLDRMCTEIAPRFPELTLLRFGALIPTGLASREGYVAREMLRDDELRALRERAPALRRVAPKSVRVEVQDGLFFQMKRDQVAHAIAADSVVKIEADGRVRGMDIYEGTVGNVLEEPFEVLWRRASERHADPFVQRTLARVRTGHDWAAACRAIDEHFASAEDLVRIRARH